MENPVYTNVSQKPEEQLSINFLAKQNLEGVTKWAKFFAIFNLCMMGLVILFVSISALFFPYAGMPIAIIFMYVIIIGIACIPLFFLYRFSTKTKEALYSSDENILAEGLNDLKHFFLIQGIFVILGMVITILGIIFAILTAGVTLMGGRGF